MTIDEQVDFKDKDISREKSLEMGKSATFNIFRPSDDDKKSDFTIRNLCEKPGIMEYKICGINYCNLIVFS